jgi:hypothetical protein
MIFVINKWFALILPAAYLAAYFFKRIKYNRYIQVEQKFPILNEKLRTAVDNAYVENEIVNNLRNEVYRDIKQVDYASFFKEKRTSYKVMCVILLCFTIMFVAQHNFEFNLDFLKDRILGFVDGGNGNTTNIIGDIISATTKGPDEDIYGEEELAELGNQKVTIQINKVGYELNVNDIKDPSETEFEESLFPDDLGMAKAEIYNKNILKENQEIVKNYFKNMANN